MADQTEAASELVTEANKLHPEADALLALVDGLLDRAAELLSAANEDNRSD